MVLGLGACGGEASPEAAPAKPEAQDQADGGAMGAFSTYQAKSMASEAKINISAITTGARILFEEERADPQTLAVSTGTLPPTIPLTPPAGTCCKQPKGQCSPDLGRWDHEGWKALGFEPRGPHRYSYEVVVEGQTVTVRAVGDLDCDGELSTYEAVGTVKDGTLEISSELKETAPLE